MGLHYSMRIVYKVNAADLPRERFELFGSNLLPMYFISSKVETLIYESNLRRISYICLRNDSKEIWLNFKKYLITIKVMQK